VAPFFPQHYYYGYIEIERSEKKNYLNAHHSTFTIDYYCFFPPPPPPLQKEENM